MPETTAYLPRDTMYSRDDKFYEMTRDTCIYDREFSCEMYEAFSRMRAMLYIEHI